MIKCGLNQIILAVFDDQIPIGFDFSLAFTQTSDNLYGDLTYYDTAKQNLYNLKIPLNMQAIVGGSWPTSAIPLWKYTGQFSAGIYGGTLFTDPFAFMNDPSGTNLLMLLSGDGGIEIEIGYLSFGLLGSNIDIPLANFNVFLNGGDRQVKDVVSGEVISLPQGTYLQTSQGDKALIPFLKGVTTTLGSLIDTLVQRNNPSFKGLSVGTDILNDIMNKIISLVDIQSGIQFYYDWQSVTSTLTIFHKLENFQVGSTSLTGLFELDCTFQLSSSTFSADCSIQVPSLTLGGLVSIIEDGAGLLVKQSGQVILAVEKLGADLTVFTEKAYQDFANAVKAGVKICNGLLTDSEALANGIIACGVQVADVVKHCSLNPPSFPSIDLSNLFNLVSVFADVPNTVADLIQEINQCIDNVAGDIATSISNLASCSLSTTTCKNSICVPFVGYPPSSCCCGLSFLNLCFSYSKYCCLPQWNNCEWSVCVDNQLSFSCNGVPVACP